MALGARLASSTLTESAETRCAQRRHGLDRPSNPGVYLARTAEIRRRSVRARRGGISLCLTSDNLLKVHHYLLCSKNAKGQFC